MQQTNIQQSESSRQAFVSLHLAVLLGGFTGLFGKLVTLNEVDIAWYRMFFAAVFLLVFTGLPKISFRKLWRLAGTGALLGFHWVLFYASIKASNISIGVVCYSLVGFFTAISIFTYNMVSYTAKQIAKHHSYENYTIGIVCPYKAEAEAINQMIESRPIDNENCKVSCGNVHSFQGDECDIMFVVLNPPAYNTSGTHVNNTNIINVAMSRARDYLFFVVPDGQIDGYNVKNKLGKIIEANVRSILHCKDIEKVIFGEENYIENNTEITPHLPVNVYYNSQAKYDVRWDDSALDIQMH